MSVTEERRLVQDIGHESVDVPAGVFAVRYQESHDLGLIGELVRIGLRIHTVREDLVRMDEAVVFGSGQGSYLDAAMSEEYAHSPIGVSLRCKAAQTFDEFPHPFGILLSDLGYGESCECGMIVLDRMFE